MGYGGGYDPAQGAPSGGTPAPETSGGGVVEPTSGRIGQGGLGPFGPPSVRPTLIQPGRFVVGSSAGGLPSGEDY